MHGSLPGLAAGRFGVIMFFSACRLPSFAPEDPPSHASENQITTGLFWLARRRAPPYSHTQKSHKSQLSTQRYTQTCHKTQSPRGSLSHSKFVE